MFNQTIFFGFLNKNITKYAMGRAEWAQAHLKEERQQLKWEWGY